MLELIEAYRIDQIRYSVLVNGLEGILDASEIRDKDLIERWYDLWGPLEIRNALDGDKVSREEVAAELDAMDFFLRTLL